MLEKILQIDQSWLMAMNNFANSSGFLMRFFRFLGIYLIYGIPLILILLWFWSQKSQKVALKATFAGLLSWVVFAKIIAYLVRRPRPFESSGIKELIFKRPDFSFPSDHAAFIFAVTFSLYLSGYKKLSYVMLVGAILISFARIGIGAHFPSDIIAGAILGVVVGWLVWLFDRPLNYVYNLIITFARKLRIA